MGPRVTELFLHVADFVVVVGANLLVQSTLLIGAGLFVAWMCRRRGAALRSAILRVPVVVLVLCPIATLALSAIGIGGITIAVPRVSFQATAAVAEASAPVAPVPEPKVAPLPAERAPFIPPAPVAHPSDPSDLSDLSAAVAPAAPVPAVSLPEPAPHVAEARGAGPAMLYGFLTMAWALGCAALLIRLILAHIRMARVRRSASPAPIALAKACERYANDMGLRAPLMLTSAQVKSPCLVGMFRPAILLPADGEDNLPAHHEIIVHELAHLARRDCVWNLFCRVVCAALCFQPFLWLLTRRIEEASDDVADDYVVRHGIDRQRYAKGLVDIAERFQPTQAEMAAGVGVVAFRSSLGRRVQRILDTTRAVSIRVGIPAGLAVAVFVVLATVGAGLIGAAGDNAPAVPDPKDEPSAPAETRDSSEAPQANEAESPSAAVVRTAPIVAHNVELIFADPAHRDGSFHGAQGVGFALSFMEVENLPVPAFIDVLLIGQCPYSVSFVPSSERLAFADGTTGQEFASEPWPVEEKRFRKVVAFPVTYGKTEYTCPVLIELRRQEDGSPTGTYWFCAYLSGKMPGGAGGRRFEIVNLDQQMEFRTVGDAGKKADAVLGVDINHDGRIDATPDGGERFWLYDTFQIDDRTYRVTEVDPYLPRVLFGEVFPDDSAHDAHAEDEPGESAPAFPSGPGQVFDGAGDFLEVPHDEKLDVGETFTVEAWVNVHRATGEHSILSKEVPWKSGWTLMVSPVNAVIERGYSEVGQSEHPLHTFTFAVGDGTGFQNLTMPISPGADAWPRIERDGWHHVAATWDKGKATLYTDGRFVCARVFPPAAPAAVPLRIGKGCADLGRHFNGRLADVRIWDVVRSEADIQRDMGRVLTGDEAGLVFSATLADEAAEPVSIGASPRSLQSYADDLLRRSEYEGAIVVLNADTGEVLAMASASREGEPEAALNKAYQTAYAPGSLFKVLLAFAALEEGKVAPETSFSCDGYFRLPGASQRPWRCWRVKDGGHGRVNLIDSLAHNCDVFFYNTAMRLGPEPIKQWSETFGLGVPTGIGLPGEAPGLIPSKEWKQRFMREGGQGEPRDWEWHDSDTLNLSIGQGQARTTPLQNAVLMAAVVNGGRRVYPYVDPSNRRVPSEPLLTDDTVKTVQEGMRQCVERDEFPRGTSYRASIPGLTVIGKTGTAQAAVTNRSAKYEHVADIPYEQRDHALFIAGVLDQEPRIAVSVVLEHGLHGGSTAAPLAKQVIQVVYGIADDAQTDVVTPGNRERRTSRDD